MKKLDVSVALFIGLIVSSLPMYGMLVTTARQSQRAASAQRVARGFSVVRPTVVRQNVIPDQTAGKAGQSRAYQSSAARQSGQGWFSSLSNWLSGTPSEPAESVHPKSRSGIFSTVIANYKTNQMFDYAKKEIDKFEMMLGVSSRDQSLNQLRSDMNQFVSGLRNNYQDVVFEQKDGRTILHDTLLFMNRFLKLNINTNLVGYRPIDDRFIGLICELLINLRSLGIQYASNDQIIVSDIESVINDRLFRYVDYHGKKPLSLDANIVNNLALMTPIQELYALSYVERALHGFGLVNRDDIKMFIEQIGLDMNSSLIDIADQLKFIEDPALVITLRRFFTDNLTVSEKHRKLVRQLFDEDLGFNLRSGSRSSYYHKLIGDPYEAISNDRTFAQEKKKRQFQNTIDQERKLAALVFDKYHYDDVAEKIEQLKIKKAQLSNVRKEKQEQIFLRWVKDPKSIKNPIPSLLIGGDVNDSRYVKEYEKFLIENSDEVLGGLVKSGSITPDEALQRAGYRDYVKEQDYLSFGMQASIQAQSARE